MKFRSSLYLIPLLALILSLLGASSTFTAAAAASTYYVKPVSAGLANCSSWANACHLQTALGFAGSGDQIWVAAGVYKPGVTRVDTFFMKTGVAIYGGFAGTETVLEQRDVHANKSILSGDLNGDDVGFANNSENSYHVVSLDGTVSGAMLDGLTIRGGNNTNSGGGIWNNGGSITLLRVSVVNNYAYFGGGVFNSNGTLYLIQSSVYGNSAKKGGGLYNASAGDLCNGTATIFITNNTFSGNSATEDGGGIYNHNGVMNLSFNTISGNTQKGGISSYNDGTTCVNATGNLVAGNVDGDVVSNNGGVIQRFNSLGYNLIGTAGANVDFALEFNQASDIVNVTDAKLLPLADNGGPSLSMALLPGSPAVDTGPNTCYSTDQRGISRPADGNKDGVTKCDIGAFEYVRTERLVNGGFNLFTKKIPSGWKAVKFGISDGKITKVKKEGAGAVRILGNGSVKTLSRTFNLQGSAGDVFDLSYWVKGAKLPKTKLCQVQVLFYNGANQVGKSAALKCPSGTFSWKQKSLAFNAPADYTKLVVKITFSKAGGTVYLDGVSLIR